MIWHLRSLALAAVALFPLVSVAADPTRQAEVAQRGAEIMPFSLKATTHVFTKSADGGRQRVVAKNATDAAQIEMVRTHLRDIQTQFLHGDFSGPSHIHGSKMPGLAQLKAAKPGQIAINYRDVDSGGELAFHTADAKFVKALHEWFDAQLSDHGHDAMEGHAHHHGEEPKSNATPP